jgi:hypothetical protein
MNYTWRLNDEKELLRNSFAGLINLLHSPAGPKYQSIEPIENNRVEFGKAFHNGLQEFHLHMINDILLVEEMLKALPRPSTAEDHASRRGWGHLRQIFRTFNDCIPWISFPEPSFMVSRICRNRQRGHLRDQNPTSVLKVIAQLSKDGETLAIWNDATRCIDLHDITAVSLNPRQISFYEVKEGPVNDEILKIVKRGDAKEIEEGMEDFVVRRGASGLRQFERFVRQQIHAGKLHSLVTNDSIEDPFTKKQRFAVSPPKPLAGYDDKELSELLREVRERDFACVTVDQCLHILAVNQDRRRDNVSIDSLIESQLKTRMTVPCADEPDCTTVLIGFQDTLYSPISMPVMMRPLEPLDIADLCIGNVVVYFMFDLNAWGRLLRETSLSWSSIKEGRRELSKPFFERQMVVGSRIPTITSPSGSLLRLGDKIIPTLVCEGIRPLAMAEQYDYLLTHPQAEQDSTTLTIDWNPPSLPSL